MMVTLILYGFATGVQSSRAIERHCREHVAYRVITGNLVPDHVTIARFICRHEQALAALFSQVLGLCAEAGLVDSGGVSVDSTRIAANASRERNQEFGQIAMEIVEQVKATDEAEDEEFGEARGDELPEQLRTPEGRREFFRGARQKLRGDAGGQELGEGAESDAETEREYEFDAERIVARVQGREGWRREAHRQLERQRWEDPAPIPSSRQERLLLAAERLEDDLGYRHHPREIQRLVFVATDAEQRVGTAGSMSAWTRRRGPEPARGWRLPSASLLRVEKQARCRRSRGRSLLVRSESPRRAAGDACLRPESGSRECRAIRAEVRRLKVSAWASAAQVGCSQVRPLRRSLGSRGGRNTPQIEGLPDLSARRG